MLTFSSLRMLLGSVTLVGLLLASSLPTQASTQTTTIRPLIKPKHAASNIKPKTETYPEVVRKQMQWVSSPAPIKAVASSEKPVSLQSKSDEVHPSETANSGKNKQPVQVAEGSQKKVSRSSLSEVVEHALSLRGVPYVFGGSSRSGFDCSGLTQYVYRNSGISLPRTASDQFRVGSPVDRSQLQSGDLVFFSTYAPGASHVGIYIGGGRFVSASNDGVSISSLTNGYFANRYIGARRP